MKVDLFVSVSEPLSDMPKGYGLIESIDFIPALNTHWYNEDTGRVYLITDIIQSKNRTIAICIQKDFTILDIWNIPGDHAAPDVCYPSCPITP